MSWTCANCGYVNEDAAVECVACAAARSCRLVLTAPMGVSWRTRIDAEVTRSVYRHLYPGVEHQYVPRNEGEHPFSLVRSNDGRWQLLANPVSPIDAVLNGNACEKGSWHVLKNGDVIAISPRGNAAKTFAPLTVSLVPVER